MKTYKQLDIYWIELDPARGHETRKKRPCVILQSDVMNKNSNLVIVAPFLPDHKKWQFVVNVKPDQQNGLDKDRHINLKQMRSVDIARIGNKCGFLQKQYRPAIEKTLRLIFGL